MRHSVFTDYSSGARRIRIKGCMVASCVLCGKRQYLSRLALSRRTRQMCGCGGTLELSEKTQKRDGLVPTAEECKSLASPRTCMFCNARLRIGNFDGVCGCLECQRIRAILGSNSVILKEVQETQKGSVDGLPGYRIVGLSRNSSRPKEFMVHLSACKVSNRMMDAPKPSGWPLFIVEAGARRT